MSQPSYRDVELLNAYLDGELDSTQRQRLESRLGSDLELKSILEELREARMVLRRLPQRRAPRNFTLTPKMAGIKPPLPRSYPVFRYASAVAAFLFFFSYLFNFAPRMNFSLGAAAPAAMEVGVGGGAPEELQRDQSGGGCDSCTAEATEMAEAPFAPAEKLPAEPLVTPTPSETEQSLAQQAPSEIGPAADTGPAPFTVPSPTTWQVILFVLACLAGGVALIVRLVVEQRWAKANAVSSRISWKDVVLFGLALLLIAAALWGLVVLVSGGPSSSAMRLPALYVGQPVDSGLKGGPSANESKGAIQPDRFSLDPSMAYEFSYVDPQGHIIALLFLAGAYDMPTDLQFSAGQGAPAPDGYVYAGRGFQIYTVPDALPLRKPVTVTIEYSDADASLVPDENQIVLLAWNGSEWIDAGIMCSPPDAIERDPSYNRVTMDVCETGSFALFAPVK